jgi:hypothetical protein
LNFIPEPLLKQAPLAAGMLDEVRKQQEGSWLSSIA